MTISKIYKYIGIFENMCHLTKMGQQQQQQQQQQQLVSVSDLASGFAPQQLKSPRRKLVLGARQEIEVAAEKLLEERGAVFGSGTEIVWPRPR